jgi:hypothetical protein
LLCMHNLKFHALFYVELLVSTTLIFLVFFTELFTLICCFRSDMRPWKKWVYLYRHRASKSRKESVSLSIWMPTRRSTNYWCIIWR